MTGRSRSRATRALQLAMLAVLALAVPSYAGQMIASPAIFQSLNQSSAECVVRNLGPKPVSLTVTIFDESGNAVATTGAGGSCDGPVPPGRSCSRVAGTIDGGTAYACVAATPGSDPKLRGKAKALRGVFVIYEAGAVARRWADLR